MKAKLAMLLGLLLCQAPQVRAQSQSIDLSNVRSAYPYSSCAAGMSYCSAEFYASGGATPVVYSYTNGQINAVNLGPCDTEQDCWHLAGAATLAQSGLTQTFTFQNLDAYNSAGQHFLASGSYTVTSEAERICGGRGCRTVYVVTAAHLQATLSAS